MKYTQGDYTNCYYEIAEIIIADADEYEVVCTVSQRDCDELIEIINENFALQSEDTKVEMGDYTFCRYDISEIVDEDEEVVCTVATDDVDVVIEILEENNQLKLGGL